MPLKTREELEEIYQNLIKRTTHVEAVQLLDSLQVDAMKHAAEMVKKSARLNENATEGNRISDLLNFQAEIILQALENREKI